jgi:rhodanese-related sulfurtransferase
MTKKFLLVWMFISFFSSCSKKGVNISHSVVVVNNDDLSFVFDENILKIDARDSAAFGVSHLPGSINLTLYDVKNNPEKVMPALDKWKGRKIVVYCYGNSCDSSMNIAQYLVYGGYQVHVYKNGWNTIKELVDHR